jgi:hypothetical protein
MKNIKNEFLDFIIFTCDWITTCRTGKLTGLFQTKQKKHRYTGSTQNWNLYSGLGNSKDQSSYVLLRPSPATQVPLWHWEWNSLCENLYFSPHISNHT